MWVKVCGNTSLEDAALAGGLGVDAVGFVFAESKRQVTAEQVAAITPYLPEGLERVGVFYSRDPEEIAATAESAGLTAVQLHGGLDDDLVERLRKRFSGGLIQTLHWVVAEESAGTQVAEQLERIAALGVVDRVLIDSKVGPAGGGTGVAFDWAKARAVFAGAPGGLRLILAGGLKPDNVAEAIGQLSPWGVDLCSGVEASPGRKDPVRLAQFIENARTAAKP